MALFPNFSIQNMTAGNQIGGPQTNLYDKYSISTWWSFYFGDHVIPNETIKACWPTGAEPPYARYLGIKGAELATSVDIYGESDIILDLSNGINLLASLSGNSSESFSLAMITNLAASLTGSGDLSAGMKGVVQMIAGLNGSGDIQAQLGMIISCFANLSGSGDATGNLKGICSMASQIVVNESELTAGQMAQAVWDQLRTLANKPGTMGELLNDAGGGSSPEVIAEAVWDANITEHQNTDSAGKELTTSRKKAAIAAGKI